MLLGGLPAARHPDRANKFAFGYSVHLSQWLPVQWFSRLHPQFDFYWNWEMDIRYTGHHYELLEGLDRWTRQQPRRGLWERNSRFYIPRYHGNYTTFSEYVEARYARVGAEMIWGPAPPRGQDPMPWDPMPPPQDTDPDWGVGEDADFISLLPIFDPWPTHYTGKDGAFNYPDALKPDGPPRLATIITFGRLSNRLLGMMDLENVREPGHHMSSEMWPQTVALHHGLKAVYAPHSIFLSRLWPAKAAEFVFNNGDANLFPSPKVAATRPGDGSGGQESVYGLDREHNFVELSTWYFRANLAGRLYKRWLGFEVGGIGGETVSPLYSLFFFFFPSLPPGTAQAPAAGLVGWG
jgi:hypothetical protein